MLKPGIIIGDRYEIIDKVGSGGMADVYKARDQRLNRFVAIKVLKQEYSSDKNFVNKFRGEAQSAAGLSHPNIVNVYDVGDDGGLHFIVMELVEGITLKRFIERKGKLDVKEAIGIGIQIAQGMEAAHDNHIIHRDIKPQNIIISKDGKVKVTDFGIAKATNSNTITSNAMGSVHYLSPEQARGGYSDEKSDIYSLGVTMYEMLSGKVPFAGDNTVSVALLHIQGEAMPLRELDSEIPVSIDKIVQKCMQKRPERRYHTASELITDLKKAITNPDGDFVQIPAYVAPDSPTINISADELSKIKSGSYIEDDTRPTKIIGAAKTGEDDEEDLDTVDTKVEKFFMIGTIAAAVILVLVIISIIVWFVVAKGKNDNNSNPSTSVTPTVAVIPSGTPQSDIYVIPNVLGQTKTNAEALIKKLDSKAFITYNDEEYSDTYAVGEIMKQYPDADNKAIKGSTIILTISKGPESMEVPNVYGMTETEADKKLTDLGLKVEHSYEASDKVEKDSVVSTDPVRGTKVSAGDTVKVIISEGPDQSTVKVPNLIGLTQKQAKAALEKVGLVLGEVGEESSDQYSKGHVTYQDYSYGQKVDKGTAVDITISSGKSSYTGSVQIDTNPFDYLDIKGDTADIKLVMDQNGKKSDIFQGQLSSGDFPYTVTDIEAGSNSEAVVRMYVNGKIFVLPGDTSAYTWDVSFQ